MMIQKNKPLFRCLMAATFMTIVAPFSNAAEPVAAYSCEVKWVTTDVFFNYVTVRVYPGKCALQEKISTTTNELTLAKAPSYFELSNRGTHETTSMNPLTLKATAELAKIHARPVVFKFVDKEPFTKKAENKTNEYFVTGQFQTQF